MNNIVMHIVYTLTSHLSNMNLFAVNSYVCFYNYLCTGMFT